MDGIVPHPRRRVEVLDNEVIVVVKDPNAIYDEREHKWYQQAFGPLRNIMESVFKFVPRGDYSRNARPNSELVLKIKYKIFEELRNEFPEELDGERQFDMYAEDDARKMFTATFSLPYGDIREFRVCEVVYNKDGEPSEPKELPADE